MALVQPVLAVVLIAILASAAWMLRYDVTPISTHAAAYKLDRWTGQITLVTPTGEESLARR